ncbi:enoyl-CoA hydratase/isomerase family protein [Pseudoalteromonas umbrosa]|uniref:enoyl-CoA hydratase/isomerase family protein n=1 Tax=Pseudoalteromonas umbrosa TaxID=3048489 RepID=UPI0024C3446B|nr:enoyl-CoA hydratase/isomerase family protein [Pseudoalteromonas sp. B95]MDK1288840.1 enoyl-CoA hydratase/isomerase family protein [Pseudoalteromonas sp. B95]
MEKQTEATEALMVDADLDVLFEHLNHTKRTLQQEASNSIECDIVADERAKLVAHYYKIQGEHLFRKLCQADTKPSSLSGWISAAKQLTPALFFESTQTEQANSQQQMWADKDAAMFVHHILASSFKEVFTLSLLQPSLKARELLDEFERNKGVQLSKIHVTVENEVATVSFLNSDCLNAEDDILVSDLAVAVDLVLLSNSVRVGVLRGGVVQHPKYSGKRIFSAGINLKYLATKNISYVDFLLQREFGYIHKLVRGLRIANGAHFDVVEKPWLGVVESFAIGGGMQLLLACDKVIAEQDSYVCLPAAKEGIVPGVANLRLANLISPKLAQQVILHGKKVTTNDVHAPLLFDEVHSTQNMDSATVEAAATLNSEAVLANRKMLRVAFEPLEQFMSYMSEFALVQVERMYSQDVLKKSSKFANSN